MAINPKIVKLYEFINNNDFNIDKIKLKKNNIAQITHDDFYTIFNIGINTFLTQFENNTITKNKNKYLKINDMLNVKNSEIFLYNYFNYYEVLKKNKKNNIQNNIQVKKSIFDIL